MNKLLLNIVKSTQKELLEKIPDYLYDCNYKDIRKMLEYIYAPGNIPVLLIAHLDTVHFTQPHEIFYDNKKKVMWSPEGIGGDDRAGVYAILEIVKTLKPHVLFTTDEEKGALGAYEVIYDMYVPEINFIIELDRRGSDDAVFYDCGNVDFQNYITSFGFTRQYGTFSDISVISPAWNIASVNLSTGYYNEHTRGEYINLSDLSHVIDQVKEILVQPNNIFYDYQKAEQEFIYKYGSLHSMTDDEWNEWTNERYI